MKPSRFDYVRVDTAQEAVTLLAQGGEDARILAGGQSLMPVLNMRLAQPALLIDISRSQSMNQIRSEAGWLRVDAAATQASVEWRHGLASEVPLLAQALPHISHFQIRNRGTVCGSAAHADPSAEIPLVLVALNGEILLKGPRKQRTLTAVEFFLGMLSTAKQADELVEAVRFPIADPACGYAFTEFSQRHGDYAACSVAAVISPGGIRLTVGAVADRPTARDWPLLEGDALDDAINAFAWDLEARDDPQVSAAARRHMVRRLGRRVIEQARSQLLSQTLSAKGHP